MRAASVLLSALLSATPARAGTTAFALVIGNNEPPVEGPRTTLRYADDDAVRFFQLFSRFADARLLTILDTQTQRRYPGLASRTEPPG